MPKIVGFREVVHQPMQIGGMRVGLGQPVEPPEEIPTRTVSRAAWRGRPQRVPRASWRAPQRAPRRAPRRGLADNGDSLDLAGYAISMGVPAVLGAGAAVLTKKDDKTIMTWAAVGGAVGLAAKVVLGAFGITPASIGAWYMRRRIEEDPVGTAADLWRGATGMGRC